MSTTRPPKLAWRGGTLQAVRPDTVSSVPQAKVIGRHTRLHFTRIQAGRAVSRLLGRAIERTTTAGAIGAALDVHENMVRRWTDESDLDALTIRDVVAAGLRGEWAFAATVLEELRVLLFVAARGGAAALDAADVTRALDAERRSESALLLELERVAAKAREQGQREGRLEALRSVHEDIHELGKEFASGREHNALCRAAHRVLVRWNEHLEAPRGAG